jgi:uncharacterized membrane protein YbhN (UPF0104 family)
MKHFSPKRFRRAEFYVVLSVVLFVAAMVGVSAFVGGEAVLGHLDTVSGSLVAGMLALSLLNYLTRASRWQLFSRRLDVRLPFWRTLVYYFAGFAMTTTPGKLGEALRLWFMERAHGYDYARIAPLFIGDRLSDLNAMVVLCIIGLGAFSGYGLAVGVLALFGVAFTLLFVQPRLLLAGVGRAYLMAGRRWPRLFAGARRTVRLTSALFDVRTMVLASLLSACGWLAECAAFAWLLQSLGAPVGFQGATFIFAFAMLAGAASMLPGGLGGVEAAMMALLVVGGTPVDVALVATMIIRVTTLWFAVGLGFAALPLGLRAVHAAQRAV